jgi:hypothetical protein
MRAPGETIIRRKSKQHLRLSLKNDKQ